MLRELRNSKYQFYDLWFEPVWDSNPTIFRNRGERANHFTTGSVF
jgi:hypothetical protein